MARIRSIKPEFFTHPSIVVLTFPARLLLISLWNQADDEGRMYDQPKRLCANAFGEEDDICPVSLFDELARHGRIIRYTVDGKACIQITGWSDHQRINRPNKSCIPPGGLTEASPVDHGSLTESSLIDHCGKGKEGKGKEGKGMGVASSPTQGDDQNPYGPLLDRLNNVPACPNWANGFVDHTKQRQFLSERDQILAVLKRLDALGRGDEALAEILSDEALRPRSYPQLRFRLTQFLEGVSPRASPHQPSQHRESDSPVEAMKRRWAEQGNRCAGCKKPSRNFFTGEGGGLYCGKCIDARDSQRYATATA